MLKQQHKTQQKAFLIYAPEKSTESWNLEMLEGPTHSNRSFDLQETCSDSAVFFNQLSTRVSHPEKEISLAFQ